MSLSRSGPALHDRAANSSWHMLCDAQSAMTIRLLPADISPSAPVLVNPDSPLEDLIRRMRAEYLEMPGLHLSVAQAQRLWNLDAETCMSVLKALLADRFLACTSNGKYRRFDVV